MINDRNQLMEILQSLRYNKSIRKKDIIHHIRSADHISISPPSLKVRSFECPIHFKDNPSHDINRDDKLYEIISWANDLCAPLKIIRNLNSGKKIKDKLLDIITTDKDGLRKAAAELMRINLKNYQVTTKEAIEKILMIIHIRENLNRLSFADKFESIDLITIIHKIFSLDFTEYYRNLLDGTYLSYFIDMLRKVLKDEKLYLLADMLNSADWDHNLRVIKQTITNGSEYIKIFSTENRINKSEDFQDLDRDDADNLKYKISMLKLSRIFCKEYIPQKSSLLIIIKNIVKNYFTSSKWLLKTKSDFRHSVLRQSIFRLRFEPCKDKSMTLRYIAGSDCSAHMDTQLTDPASSFYKIMFFNEWIGYITLLSVKTSEGIKAVLIDVINICESIRSNISTIDLFIDNFLDYFIEYSELNGHRYILIPGRPHYLSNTWPEETDQTDHHLYNKPSIRGPLLLYRGKNDEYQCNPDSEFQSLKCKYFIVLREFDFHEQGILPGLEDFL